MPSLLESLKQDLLQALINIGILRAKQKHMPNPANREVLYSFAKASIGQDISPKDYAPDDLGCAESLSKVIQLAFTGLRFPTLLSTRELQAYFQTSPSFEPVSEPQYGDVILSVTGTGNGSVSNGHTGIVGKTWIMSNDSRTGFWEANFQLASWKRYYEIKGGMATHFYRII